MPKSKDKKLNQNGEHVYIASPFFNDRQIAVVDMIKKTIEEKTKLQVFSPKDSGGILKPTSSADDRAKVVRDNIAGVQKAIFVIAVLDYPLADPTKHEMRIVRPTTMRVGLTEENKASQGLLAEMVSPPLWLTDNGVCFECGFAKSAAIPVIGYVHDAKVVKRLNVMLTDTAEGVLMGMQSLVAFLESWKGFNAESALEWGSLKPWQNRTQ